ncbi:MAG: DUF1932 domain-containing protein [Hyphomicrobiaceae bacterium]
MKVGVLHPGEMGVSVAASIIDSGHTVYWAGEGRSDATRVRAAKHGLLDLGSVAELCSSSDTVISVCPPEYAAEVADEVRSVGFDGTYVDANAISPVQMSEIAKSLQDAGITVVDAGIVGLPAWQPGTTWIWLSGQAAGSIVPIFLDGPLQCDVLSAEVGQASALKMCYAALTKGTTALTCSIVAVADQLGVREALNKQWDRGQPGLSQRNETAICGVTSKAWRFVAEMQEVAETFEAGGLPGGFHRSAAEVFARLAAMKEGPHPSDLDLVLKRLNQPANLGR